MIITKKRTITQDDSILIFATENEESFCDKYESCHSIFKKIMGIMTKKGEKRKNLPLLLKKLSRKEKETIAGGILFFADRDYSCVSCPMCFEASHLGILIKEEISKRVKKTGHFEDWGPGIFAVIKKFLMVQIIPREKNISVFCRRAAIKNKKGCLSEYETLVWKAISIDCECFISHRTIVKEMRG